MYLPISLIPLVKKEKFFHNGDSGGFTVVELLAVITLIGAIVAIAIPSWLEFINQQRTNAAQSSALTLLRDAQAQAKLEKLIWQVCFWDDGNRVLASAHRAPANNQCQTTHGKPLIQSDSSAIRFTSTFTQNPTNYYRVQFKYDGSVNGQLGKITFTARNNNSAKRCTIISTLLGTIRTEKDHRCD